MSEPPIQPGAPEAVDLEDLFDNAPCGYLVLSPAGAIIRANTTLARWLGRDAADLVGQPFRDLLTTPGRIFYETHIAPQLSLHGRFEEVALDLIGGAGAKIPILANAIERRNAAGDVSGVRLALFRAKDRRGYERTLQGREAVAEEKLQDEQAASQLREQFIAVLGHDLRNPLASIVGAARLLRRELQSDKALRVIDMMEESVDRMAGLIDHVMDFARGRLGGGIDVQRATAPLEPVLRHVVAELEASQPSRRFICVFDLPDPISFDASRLGQLVSNLLGNALAHGDARQPIKLGASTASGALELWVANAGQPIPPAALERLFQPFFRGELRASQQGLGLGLYIASEIAKAHGGTLTVQSDAAETRFTFRMPLA